jgi:hypothetical protein
MNSEAGFLKIYKSFSYIFFLLMASIQMRLSPGFLPGEEFSAKDRVTRVG